jgi:hypothetical protein
MAQSQFNDQQLKILAAVLLKTKPAELTCDEWLDAIAPYAEAILKDGQPPIDSVSIQHHLEICPECREEFEALLSAMRSSTNE